MTGDIIMARQIVHEWHNHAQQDCEVLSCWVSG